MFLLCWYIASLLLYVYPAGIVAGGFGTIGFYIVVYGCYIRSGHFYILRFINQPFLHF
jgi:hypothetical protein